MTQPRQEDLERAKEIAWWLYDGPDKDLSEGLVRTLQDKIAAAFQRVREEQAERDAELVMTTPSYSFQKMENMKDKIKATEHLEKIVQAIRERAKGA